jgi:hypothetical protein
MAGANRVLKVMADLEHLLDVEPVAAATPTAASVAIGLARAKLKPPMPRTSVWALIGAAGLAAASATSLAAVVILGPPIGTTGHTQADVNPWVR